MKKVLVLGMGKSGLSAARFLVEKGWIVVGADAKKIDVKENGLPEITTILDSEIVDVESFDQVVLSPGISLSHPIIRKAQTAGVEIIGEIELAFRELEGKVLAITGTNGKTTVTLMVEHILRSTGIDARAAGNVGRPLTSEMKNKADVWVVELSSYQIETLQTKKVDGAVILNITPDHLDRYNNFQDYAQAKLKLGQLLKPGGNLYITQRIQKEFGVEGLNLGFDDSCDIYSDGKNIIIKTIEYLIPERYRYRMNHEVENLMACYALCQDCGVQPDEMTRAAESFTKPSHRIEFVRQYNGVSYYDDSKGTNIDAVVHAVKAMDGPTILIAGGVDKGSSYNRWINEFQNKVSQVFAIGQAASKIATELEGHLKVVIVDSLEQAIFLASEQAEPGENVLLSPGCASFDMFKDYQHRGDEFKRIVNNLESKA